MTLHKINQIKLFKLLYLYVIVVTVYLATLFVVLGAVRACIVLHKSMLANLLRAPINFHDATPKGRILGRFSNDLNTIDYTIWQNIRGFLNCACRVRV